MSLEEALRENTETMKQLISALLHPVNATRISPASGSTGAPDTGVAAKDSEVEKPAEVELTLSYKDDVRKPFLALLNSNRPAAMKMLEDLGVTSLKGFEDKPETYADLVKRIKEAQNG